MPLFEFSRSDGSPVQDEDFQVLEVGRSLQMFARELFAGEFDRLHAAKEANLVTVHQVPPPLESF